MPAVQETVERVRRLDVDQYKYGFETIIESEKAPKGLNEDVIRYMTVKVDELEAGPSVMMRKSDRGERRPRGDGEGRGRDGDREGRGRPRDDAE